MEIAKATPGVGVMAVGLTWDILIQAGQFNGTLNFENITAGPVSMLSATDEFATLGFTTSKQSNSYSVCGSPEFYNGTCVVRLDFDEHGLGGRHLFLAVMCHFEHSSSVGLRSHFNPMRAANLHSLIDAAQTKGQVGLCSTKRHNVLRYKGKLKCVKNQGHFRASAWPPSLGAY